MQANQFNILGIVERDDEYGLSYTSVTVKMPIKVWSAMKRRGQLGTLYGVDISNEVYRTHGVPAHNPSVDDSKRATQGIKTIKLTYYNTAIKQPKLRLIQGGKV